MNNVDKKVEELSRFIEALQWPDYTPSDADVALSQMVAKALMALTGRERPLLAQYIKDQVEPRVFEVLLGVVGAAFLYGRFGHDLPFPEVVVPVVGHG